VVGATVGAGEASVSVVGEALGSGVDVGSAGGGVAVDVRVGATQAVGEGLGNVGEGEGEIGSTVSDWHPANSRDRRISAPPILLAKDLGGLPKPR
jgi:hypothetical protein